MNRNPAAEASRGNGQRIIFRYHVEERQPNHTTK